MRAPRRALRAVRMADDDDDDRIGAGGKGGHAVGAQPDMSEEEKALQMKVMTHQKSAARLGMAEDARSLVAYMGHGLRGAVDALVGGGGLSVGVAGALAPTRRACRCFAARRCRGTRRTSTPAIRRRRSP